MSVSKIDLLVIGGGSGGIATANRAAMRGAKNIKVIEKSKIGGTCVNVGCVPKKVMWNASNFLSSLDHAGGFGFGINREQMLNHFDFEVLKRNRDAFIQRLNGIYMKNMDKNGIQLVTGEAKFVGGNAVAVGDQVYESENIVIATGGTPVRLNIPGGHHGYDSDGFFNYMNSLPKKVAVVGGGYIGVELSGVLNSLGAETHLICRRDNPLFGFDNSIRTRFSESMIKSGIKLSRESALGKVVKKDNGKYDLYHADNILDTDFDAIIWAVGRKPIVDIGLENTKVKLNSDGFIEVDDYQNTTQKGIYAIGDVTGKKTLTPVAIAAGRKLAERLFNNQVTKQDFTNIPSVVFAHPPIGTVGLSEEEAIIEYGKDEIKTFETTFTDMYYSLSTHREPTYMKMITEGPSERIVGLHIFGHSSDEMIQGFAVALKLGATRQDFHNTVPIHPTSSEEVVLL